MIDSSGAAPEPDDSEGPAARTEAEPRRVARPVLIQLTVAAEAETGSARRLQSRDVSFDRHELRLIMNVYGRMVAAGVWRDYAIDFGPDKAVFSIFRRTSEMPLYRVVKDPALARRQGAYAVIASGGLVMKRGHELERVLRVLDRPVAVPV